MSTHVTTCTGSRASEIVGFDCQVQTRLIFGSGAVDQVGDLAVQMGAHHALLVTDPGIVSAGHARRVHDAVVGAGVPVTMFDRVRENPTTRDVNACVQVAKSATVDAIVGLGGGSSMDTAKGCNFLLSNGGRMSDYWGVGKARYPMLPLIAVPTTAGTGSECQSFALIADEQTHQKMACGDPKAAARVALLDPTLTLTQPRHVAACTGIDAVAHAVESAVTSSRNPLSMLYAHEAFRLTHVALPRVLSEPDDLDARARMQLGAAYGGVAIEHSMLGAAHSAANPLTAHYGMVHGHAVGVMLPHVVRFNAEDHGTCEEYAELAKRAGLTNRAHCDIRSAVDALLTCLRSLLDVAKLSGSLAQYGVHRSDIAGLAHTAAGQWTARFNPRPIDASNFQRLYEAAYENQGG